MNCGTCVESYYKSYEDEPKNSTSTFLGVPHVMQILHNMLVEARHFCITCGNTVMRPHMLCRKDYSTTSTFVCRRPSTNGIEMKILY